jgi:hypothetical protein
MGRPTHGRGRNHFLDPPGPRPAFGRPGSPERDCGPGRQSRNRPELSTPRIRCSALHARLGSSLGITGPGPGETDSDVSLRQNPVTCWTRMEDPHVKAGEVVSRKTPSHGTIRRGRFIKSRPEQFCCTAQLNLPLLTRDPEIKPQYASGFPCRPCRLHIVSCFSVARGSFRQIFLLLEDRGSFRLLLLLEDLSAEVYPDDSTNLPFPG